LLCAQPPELAPIRLTAIRENASNGRWTIEEFNNLIVDGLIQQTGERDQPRLRIFSVPDWQDGTKIVRVEQNNVPILCKPELDLPPFDVFAIATNGELFAFAGQYNISNAINPTSRVPDRSGLWYKVTLWNHKQGWIFAEPTGRHKTPIARSYTIENGVLVILKDREDHGNEIPVSAIDNARLLGLEAGNQDGRMAGEAVAFNEAAKTAERVSYDETLRKLYASGEYTRLSTYTALVNVTGFLIGFGAQFALMHIIRKCGLRDVDRIVIGSDPRKVGVDDTLLAMTRREQTWADNGITKLVGFFALLCVLPLGCENKETEVYKKAYVSSFEDGRESGRQLGEARGRIEGAQKGAVRAREQAKQGRAWQLYSGLGLNAMLWGGLTGLSSQYIILLVCALPVRRFRSRLDILFSAPTRPNLKQVLDCAGLDSCHDLSIALIPGMRNTVSYAIMHEWQKVFKQIRDDRIERATYIAETLENREVELLQTIERKIEIERLNKIQKLVEDVKKRKMENLINFQELQVSVIAEVQQRTHWPKEHKIVVIQDIIAVVKKGKSGILEMAQVVSECEAMLNQKEKQISSLRKDSPSESNEN